MPERPSDVDLLRRPSLFADADQGVAAMLLAAGMPLRLGRGEHGLCQGMA